MRCLLTAFASIALLLPAAHAVTLYSPCGDFTAPSVVFSLHCWDDTVYANLNDISGEVDLSAYFYIPVAEGDRPVSYSTHIEALASGFLFITASSPAVVTDFSSSYGCNGSVPYGEACAMDVSVNGELEYLGIPTNVLVPYTMRIYAYISGERYPSDPDTFSGWAYFVYNLRDAEIRDYETGAILEGAAVRFLSDVPEPATGTLIGLGCLALGIAYRRRR